MGRLVDDLDTGRIHVPAGLRELVETAFAKHRPPDGAHIMENRYHCRECQAIYKLLRGRTWKHVDTGGLCYEEAAPTFMAPEGLAYYLPALLLITISDHPERGNLEASLEYLFTITDGDRLAWRQARVALLNPAELRATATVLRANATRRPEWLAPDQEWTQFDTELLEACDFLDAEAAARG